MNTVTVKEVHNSFKTIDSSITENYKHSLIQLRDFGFENCKNITKNKSNIRLSISEIDEIDFREMLQSTFKNCRIITKESVMKLCEKYGFIMKPSSKYVGSIPIKNINEILKFNTKLHKQCRASQGVNGSRVYELKKHFRIRVNLTNFVVASPKYFDDSLPEKDYTKDPIVLCEFKYEGLIWYIIVSMWGNEELAYNIFDN